MALRDIYLAIAGDKKYGRRSPTCHTNVLQFTC